MDAALAHQEPKGRMTELCSMPSPPPGRRRKGGQNAYIRASVAFEVKMIRDGSGALTAPRVFRGCKYGAPASRADDGRTVRDSRGIQHESMTESMTIEVWGRSWRRCRNRALLEHAAVLFPNSLTISRTSCSVKGQTSKASAVSTTRGPSRRWRRSAFFRRQQRIVRVDGCVGPRPRCRFRRAKACRTS